MTELDLDEKTRKEYIEILRSFRKKIGEQKKWEDSLSEEERASLDEIENENRNIIGSVISNNNSWFPNNFCGVCGEIVPDYIEEHCNELTIVHCGNFHPLFDLDGKYLGFQQSPLDNNMYIVENGDAVAIGKIW